MAAPTGFLQTATTFVQGVGALVGAVLGVFGLFKKDKGPPPIDTAAIHRDYAAAFAQKESDFAREMEQKLQQLRLNMSNDTLEERRRAEERFKEELERQQAARASEKLLLEEQIRLLTKSQTDAEARVQEVLAKLLVPIKEREQKLALVNNLKLPIRRTNSLLITGVKGSGKSTFLWLLGRGEKPKFTYGDGTVEIIHLRGYVDSIGLRGWTPEELMKLLVLLVYDGIPADVVVCSNERIALPVRDVIYGRGGCSSHLFLTCRTR